MAKPKVAVWKFASCDGCQLTLLDCEDELLQLADVIDIVKFPEATRIMKNGPYDLSIVEGSISTPHDLKQIQAIRKDSAFLLTIGACATTGGIQALRNYAKVEEWVQLVYASPEYIETLDKVTPISAHVKVDYELRGCPINKKQLIEVITSILHQKKPNIPNVSVCIECKLQGNVCVAVTKSLPCLGPVTHAGCGALCPGYQRACYGCFGPNERPNLQHLKAYYLAEHCEESEWRRMMKHINNSAPELQDDEHD